MVSTYTTAKNLEQVGRGDQVGVWDAPVNSNWGLVDAALGQYVVIPLNNSPVVLSAAQFQCNAITFNGTLAGNVAITFPASYIGPYQINNNTTGAFTITLQTTVAGGFVVGCPQGDPIDIFNFGSAGGIVYKNFGRVGTYWDYAGSSVPAWVTACTKPPFLNCDGSTFSSATYPALAAILGGTTLPDARGRTRASLNQGSGRMDPANGVNGDAVRSGGGADSITLTSAQLASHTHANTVSETAHVHDLANSRQYGNFGNAGSVVVGPQLNNGYVPGAVGTTAATAGVTISNAAAGGGASHSNMQPTLVGGITMIRAG